MDWLEEDGVDDGFDVAIVGYGPVGQLLAILLGRCGWRVGVFEKQPLLYPMPRAVHFDHEVGRILQNAGLGAVLAELSEPADIYDWRNAAGETLLRIRSDGPGLSGWPSANMFSQPELERRLDGLARQVPSVVVHRGVEVTDLEVGADGVELVVSSAGESSRVRARYVVGCDGANSFVRQRMNTAITDLGFFFEWLIVDVIPRQARVWDPINLQICDPKRPTTVISGGPGRRRWEFMRLPGEDLAELNTTETAWKLLQPWDLNPDNAVLERHAVYRFQARWVDAWRDGRLLLAGDSAHQTPPFAGQGMCAGMRDAINLAWKLDLVMGGKSGAALLDTYCSERAPHVRMMIEFAIELGKVICVSDPEEAAARDVRMIETARTQGPITPMPAIRLGPGLFSTESSLGGELFLQGQVGWQGREGRFDDVVGRGFTLLSRSEVPVLPADLAGYFAQLGGIVAHFGGKGGVQDRDGLYGRWFADQGVDVVLQRPDFYLFGAAAGAQAGASLVGQLRESLAGM